PRRVTHEDGNDCGWCAAGLRVCVGTCRCRSVGLSDRTVEDPESIAGARAGSIASEVFRTHGSGADRESGDIKIGADSAAAGASADGASAGRGSDPVTPARGASPFGET